jgi:hypothetical protein
MQSVVLNFSRHVDEDLWLKLDNGSLVWEIVSVALFHLGGQLLCPSPVLSPPREKGYYWGASQG